MPNKIMPKRSYTANAVPTVSGSTPDIERNEIAINWADSKLYTRNSSDQLVSITLGGGGGGGSVVSSVAGRTGAVTLTSADVSGVVPSTTSGITGAAAITNMVSLTQAQYDALSSKSATTLYIISG
jgi:hypothetical protein